MLASRVVILSLVAVAFAPCDGLGGSDGGSASATDSGTASDGANAPVVDDVTIPDTATIDVSTGVAHIVGSISFHDDFSQVIGVNVLAHGTSASIYRGSLGSSSPQTLIFDLSSAGTRVLDFNVFDAAGAASAAISRTITVQ